MLLGYKVKKKGVDMKKKIDKYQTLLEFLKVIAPDENYIKLQMAQVQFVSDIMHKAVEGKDFDSSITPEALAFVKSYSKKVRKDLQLFLENLKDTEFLNYEENNDYEVVRSEITSFLSIFESSNDEDVREYYKMTSSVYALLK